MTVKHSVAEHLKAHMGQFVSGESMADQLGVTRAAVWKAVQALEQDGYPITALRKQGYMLEGSFDVLDGDTIEGLLPTDVANLVSLRAVRQTGSTNTDLRKLADEGAPEFTAIVAGEQTSGKGRRGREFYSLGDTGVYLSILVKPDMAVQQAVTITCAAAVAVCRALKQVCNADAKIKWVNDVYVGDRKVCGILTEGVTDIESGGLSYAIVGIGVNVYEPDSGFPDRIANRAGCLLSEKQCDIRNRIAAAIITEFTRCAITKNPDDYLAEYRSKSFLPGMRVTVLDGTDKGKPATAIAICDDLSLAVRYDDGTEQNLHSGEVSIKL